MQTFAILAALAASAAAIVTPVGTPSGNPISKPGLGDIVNANAVFNIIWEPTTSKEGTVTLVLCKGPSSNCIPQTPAIVEGLKNTGSYAWSVPKDLEPTTGAQGYGIQLIVEANGQNQYTTQFGVSNPEWKNTSSSSSVASTSATSTSKSSSASATKTSSASHSSSKTTKTATTTAAPTTTSVGSTGGPATESVTPTGTLTVPSSLLTSTTSAASTSPARVTSNAAAPTGGAKAIGWAAVAGMGLGALVL